MENDRYIIVTVDTEVDKDKFWRISSPPKFDSVIKGIPDILTPLFRTFGIRPTYLLSYEVIENQKCCDLLLNLGNDVELGTHLHVDFVPPSRTLEINNMGGNLADSIQLQLSLESEKEKLLNLTNIFSQKFGYSPKSFRSGRYGRSINTNEILTKLGYIVDSSVTPGLCWNYPEGKVDFRDELIDHHWITFPYGKILEIPISVLPESKLAIIIRDFPELCKRIISKIFGANAKYLWFRPSWGNHFDLIRYLNISQEKFIVMILHSMEVIPGASPYATDAGGVAKIVNSMNNVFKYARDNNFKFCTLSEAAQLCLESDK